MSESFVAACGQRAADTTAADLTVLKPPLVVRQTTSVFREDLLSLVLEHLLLPDLCSTLAVNGSFRAQTRARIDTLWPTLSPLLSPPWRMTATELLSKTKWNVSHLEMGDARMTAFAGAIGVAAKAGALASLRWLHLGGNNIGDEGMTAFAGVIRDSGSLANLECLRLDGNQIGNDGIKAFASAIAMGSLANLTTLRLEGNPIDDDIGMLAFSSAIASGSLASLTGLYVNNPGHTHIKAACHQRGITLYGS